MPPEVRRYAVMVEPDPDYIEPDAPMQASWSTTWNPMEGHRAVLLRRDDGPHRPGFPQDIGPSTVPEAWNRVGLIPFAEARAIETMSRDLIEERAAREQAERRLGEYDQLIAAGYLLVRVQNRGWVAPPLRRERGLRFRPDHPDTDPVPDDHEWQAVYLIVAERKVD